MATVLYVNALYHRVSHLSLSPPQPPLLHVHPVISMNKREALEAMGGSMKGRKEQCSWSVLNGALSHLERPVYSTSIMGLIFWSLLSNSTHPHTQAFSTLPSFMLHVLLLSPCEPRPSDVSVQADLRPAPRRRHTSKLICFFIFWWELVKNLISPRSLATLASLPVLLGDYEIK